MEDKGKKQIHTLSYFIQLCSALQLQLIVQTPPLPPPRAYRFYSRSSLLIGVAQMNFNPKRYNSKTTQDTLCHVVILVFSTLSSINLQISPPSFSCRPPPPCPSYPITTSPFFAATRETAFFRAISSAAIAHEFTHQCTQNRLKGCKCFNKSPTKSEYAHVYVAHVYAGCGDDIEFGQRKAELFFDQLEKGNQASRKAVNLHNNKVGREVSLIAVKHCLQAPI